MLGICAAQQAKEILKVNSSSQVGCGGHVLSLFHQSPMLQFPRLLRYQPAACTTCITYPTFSDRATLSGPFACVQITIIAQNVQGSSVMRSRCDNDTLSLHHHEVAALAEFLCNFSLGSPFSCVMQPTGNVLILSASTNHYLARPSLAKPCIGQINLRPARLSSLP